MTPRTLVTVTNAVPDDTLAEMLDALSMDLPVFVNQLTSGTAEPSDLERMIDSFDAVIALTAVRSARALFASEGGAPEKLPAVGGTNVAEYCAKVAWLLHDLSCQLFKGSALRHHFDAALSGFRQFRPVLGRLLSALQDLDRAAALAWKD